MSLLSSDPLLSSAVVLQSEILRVQLHVQIPVGVCELQMKSEWQVLIDNLSNDVLIVGIRLIVELGYVTSVDLDSLLKDLKDLKGAPNRDDLL